MGNKVAGNGVQLGDSATATQNFTLTAAAADGTMKLARGNAGATTQDVLTVDANGKPSFPQGLASGSFVETGSAGMGYGTGSGGTVTQLTSKATTVTLNKPTGQITMNNAALAANTTVVFGLSNSLITSADNVVVTIQSVTLGIQYNVWVYAVQSGACVVAVRNITAGSLSEALVINYAIIKGATS